MRFTLSRTSLCLAAALALVACDSSNQDSDEFQSGSTRFVVAVAVNDPSADDPDEPSHLSADVLSLSNPINAASFLAALRGDSGLCYTDQLNDDSADFLGRPARRVDAGSIIFSNDGNTYATLAYDDNDRNYEGHYSQNGLAPSSLDVSVTGGSGVAAINSLPVPLATGEDSELVFASTNALDNPIVWDSNLDLDSSIATIVLLTSSAASTGILVCSTRNDGEFTIPAEFHDQLRASGDSEVTGRVLTVNLFTRSEGDVLYLLSRSKSE